jgi:hypothetical protein
MLGRVAVLAGGTCLLRVIFTAYQEIAYPTAEIVAYKLNCPPYAEVRYYEEVRLADEVRCRLHGAHMAALGSRPATLNDTDSLAVLVNFALL